MVRSPSGPSGPFPMAAEPSSRADCDAVVIGAGVAGLAAARRLSNAGLKVIIVEARDRAGGRIHSLRPSGWPLPIEAGAEFIHGRPEETWSIVRGANLAASVVPENHQHSPDGRLQPLDFNDTW